MCSEDAASDVGSHGGHGVLPNSVVLIPPNRVKTIAHSLIRSSKIYFLPDRAISLKRGLKI